MQARLTDIAAWVSGTLHGDGEVLIHAASVLADARGGEITLVSKVEKLPELSKCPAAAAVVPTGCAASRSSEEGTKSLIEVADVQAAFAIIVQRFRPPREHIRVGVHPAAHVSPTACLGEDVEVRPFATIGDDVKIGPHSTIHSGARLAAGCQIGAHVVIHANVVLYEDTIIGDHAVIHSGTVLGAAGFGYRIVNGRHEPVPQLGWVEIGPHVEIGACTAIDRGTFGATRIAEGTKIDNLVHIGHNTRIGKHNILCGQVGIAGSSSTGEYVVMGGQAGVRDHVHIGDRAQLGAHTGVMTDLEPDKRYFDSPAFPEREGWIRVASVTKLPELRKTVKRLEKQVDALEERIGCEKPLKLESKQAA